MTGIPATGSFPTAARGAHPLQALAHGLVFGGTVYGVALNDAAEVAKAIAEAAKPKPAPVEPVLFIKPRNTYLADGGVVPLPAGMDQVAPCAAIGVVFGRDTQRVSERQALDGVAGYLLAIDVSEPGAGYYRPPIREKSRDGFLPIGATLVPAAAVADPDAIELRLKIDGQVVARTRGQVLIRSVARLIAEVSGYMTFEAGDMLLAILTTQGPLAARGSRVQAEADGLGTVACVIGAEEPA